MARIYVDNTNPTFVVGEIWSSLNYNGDGKPSTNQDAGRHDLVNWVQSVGEPATAFDFTTKGVLQAAVQSELWRMRDSNGKAPGMMGRLPEKAVTFVDNHDTGSTQALWPLPSDKVMQGYAYILTHPGIPCIFYDHVFDWNLKHEITILAEIRSRNGIHPGSTLDILKAEGDVYVAMIDDKLGPRYDVGNLIPSDFLVVAHGSNCCFCEAFLVISHLRKEKGMGKEKVGGAHMSFGKRVMIRMRLSLNRPELLSEGALPIPSGSAGRGWRKDRRPFVGLVGPSPLMILVEGAPSESSSQIQKNL